MNIWDDIERLDRLEQQRKKLRESGKRLTFDCFFLKTRDGNRVYCSKGLSLGQARDGSLDLISVLRGILSGACKRCPFFEEEYMASDTRLFIRAKDIKSGV